MKTITIQLYGQILFSGRGSEEDVAELTEGLDGAINEAREISNHRGVTIYFQNYKAYISQAHLLSLSYLVST